MNELKSWYFSKTVWGAVVAAGASLFGLFGMPVGAADQAAVTEALLQGAGALGAVLAVIGRFTATSQIR